MGIKQLAKLIADVVPEAIKEQEIAAYFGRRIAIDASTSLYQFLVAIRLRSDLMVNGSGEATSHLIGFFHRTNKLLENGIKPIYVFDGKPPEMKSGELEKRSEKRKEAEQSLSKAIEDGNEEEILKFNKRTIRVTSKHNDDCKKLLRLMGLPVVEAPSEAEAQCAQLCKDGKVYAVATEDMDALTFGTTKLVRHLSSGSGEMTHEYSLDKVLNGMGLETMDQFIDLCILMGCDYSDSIKGIGGKKGLDLIKKHKSIEKIIESLPNKDAVPQDWNLELIRRLFREPEVIKTENISDEDLKFKDIDEDGLVEFLCKENGFDEKRVRNAIERCKASKPKSAQTRIDSFFQVKPADPNTVKKSPAVPAKGSAKKTGPGNKRFKAR